MPNYLLLLFLSMSRRWQILYNFSLVLFLLFWGTSAWAGEKSFPGSLFCRVRKGDTLWSISRRYGLSVQELARANGIDDPYFLRVGQELKIPFSNYDYFEKNLKLKPGLKLKKWKYIVIHHSATDTGNARRFDYFHRKIRHMKRGMAYHFVIGNGRGLGDGEVEVGSRWTLQQPGGHLRQNKYNEIALGICLVGNFDKKPPTKKQMESLRALTRFLQVKSSIPRSRVLGHREMPGARTRCPGRLFPLRSFRQKILP